MERVVAEKAFLVLLVDGEQPGDHRHGRGRLGLRDELLDDEVYTQTGRVMLTARRPRMLPCIVAVVSLKPYAPRI